MIIKRLLLVLIVLFLVTACLPPVYQNVRVTPPEATDCIADAQEERLRCRQTFLREYQQCRRTQDVLQQQKMLQDQLILNTAQTNHQNCLSQCLTGTHGSGLRNTEFYCNSLGGPCASLKNRVDTLERQMRNAAQETTSCDYVYESCDNLFEIQFQRCGGYWQQQCVQFCD